MPRERELTPNLRIGASCDGEGIEEFAFGQPALSFGDVAGYRDRSPPELVGKAEDLLLRKRSGQRVDLNR